MTMDEMWPQELQIMARIEGGLEGELHRMLRHLYLAILKVDLMEDTAYLLQSVDQSDKVSCVFSWAEYLTLYSSMLLEEEQSRMLEEFSGYHLAELMQEGVSIYSRDYPYYKQGAVNWVTMTAYLDGIEEGLPTAYITAQVSCEDHFIKSLVDLYVYDKCDYFMYIDSQNSRYSLFSGQSKGLRLPPAPTRDYGEGLARYTEHFVVPEDREMVTRKMELGHILERLEEKGSIPSPAVLRTRSGDIPESGWNSATTTRRPRRCCCPAPI